MMNCLCFEKGETATLYCSFVIFGGQEPVTVTDPKITISHIDDGSFVVDVNEAAMIFMAENTYYYKWSISDTAFEGFYNVECEAVLDGEYAEVNYTVKVE